MLKRELISRWKRPRRMNHYKRSNMLKDKQIFIASKHCESGKFCFLISMSPFLVILAPILASSHMTSLRRNFDLITEFRASHFHTTKLQKLLLCFVLQKKNHLLILWHLNWLDAEAFSSFIGNFF